MDTITIIFRNRKPFSESRIKYSLEIVMLIDHQQFRLKSTSYIFHCLLCLFIVYTLTVSFIISGHHTGYWNEDTADGTLEVDAPSLKMSQWAVA